MAYKQKFLLIEKFVVSKLKIVVIIHFFAKINDYLCAVFFVKKT